MKRRFECLHPSRPAREMQTQVRRQGQHRHCTDGKRQSPEAAVSTRKARDQGASRTVHGNKPFLEAVCTEPGIAVLREAPSGARSAKGKGYTQITHSSSSAPLSFLDKSAAPCDTPEQETKRTLSMRAEGALCHQRKGT